MASAQKTCDCSLRPAVMLGSAKRYSEKRFERVAEKAHPQELLTKKWCAIRLLRCLACGQHWQADLWNRRHGYMSWPELSIKVDAPQDWQRFKDYDLRLAYFPAMEKGVVDGNRVARCTAPKCTDLAVVGLEHCANCACRALHPEHLHER